MFDHGVDDLPSVRVRPLWRQHQLVTEKPSTVLQAMMESLKDVPHVAGKVCYSIQSFIQAVTEAPPRVRRHALLPEHHPGAREAGHLANSAMSRIEDGNATRR